MLTLRVKRWAMREKKKGKKTAHAVQSERIHRCDLDEARMALMLLC